MIIYHLKNYVLNMENNYNCCEWFNSSERVKIWEKIDKEENQSVLCDRLLKQYEILAANYMDIKPLLDLACAQVATQIKGKSPEEIREQFNIVNDFTSEEAQIREENK